MTYLAFWASVWSAEPASVPAQKHLLAACLAAPGHKDVVDLLTRMGISRVIDPGVRSQLRQHRNPVVRRSAWRTGPVDDDAVAQVARTEKSAPVRAAILERRDLPHDTLRALATPMTVPVAKIILADALDEKDTFPGDVLGSALVRIATSTGTYKSCHEDFWNVLGLDESRRLWAMNCPDLPWEVRLGCATVVMSGCDQRERDDAHLVVPVLEAYVAAGVPAVGQVGGSGNHLFAPVPRDFWLSGPFEVLTSLLRVYQALAATDPGYRTGVAVIEEALEWVATPARERLELALSPRTPGVGRVNRPWVVIALEAWCELAPQDRMPLDVARILIATAERTSWGTGLGQRVLEATRPVHAEAARAAWAANLLDPAAPAGLAGWLAADVDLYADLFRSLADQGCAGSVASLGQCGYAAAREDLGRRYLADPAGWPAHGWRLIPRQLLDRQVLLRLPTSAVTGVLLTQPEVASMVADLVAEHAACAADPDMFGQVWVTLLDSDVPLGTALEVAVTASA